MATRFSVFLLALIATTACSKPPSDGHERPPNLLFIVIDTLRADQLALLGGPTATPSIEALARRGVLFERAYCHAPITGPSHATMFTSMLPSAHRVLNNAQVLRAERTTLAELLEGTHRTAAFISLEALNSKYGVLQGFEEIHERFPKYWWKNAGEVNAQMLPWLDENAGGPFFLLAHYSDPHGPYTPPDWYQPVDLALNGAPLPPVVADGRPVRVALDLREGDNDLSFTVRGARDIHLSRWKLPGDVEWGFAEGWRYDVSASGKRRDDGPRGARIASPGVAAHLRLRSSTAREVELKVKSHFVLDANEQRRGYGAETAYVDAEIGALFARMDRLDLWKNTVVVLTADHGEELGERGGKFEHVQRLYDSTVHVPLIIAAPGSKDAGRRVPQVVRHVDLLPTLARLVGFEAPKAAVGIDLFGPKGVDGLPAVSETYRKQAARDRASIRLGRYKLIRTQNRQGNGEELYDMEADAAERRDLLAGSGRADAGLEAFGEALRVDLGRRMDALRAPADGRPRAEAIEAELTEQDVEALRALGYVE